MNNEFHFSTLVCDSLLEFFKSQALLHPKHPLGNQSEILLQYEIKYGCSVP